MFSGEDQTIELIEGAAEIGFGMLILLAISKLFATALLLTTGWKGGYIFPIMFAGIALGMACEYLFPGVSLAVNVAAVLAGALVTTLKAPLFTALFTLVMVDANTAPVVAIAVLVGALLAAFIGQRQARRAVSESTPESTVVHD
jgi:H+/Cl- antiporter ClcA